MDTCNEGWHNSTIQLTPDCKLREGTTVPVSSLYSRAWNIAGIKKTHVKDINK